jgi:DNA invertase Pin-like site-specific DNA recombinase
MRAALYTRISNDPKLEGLGVQRQLDDLLALADQLGWEVVARFDDNDTSAFNGKTRPGFEAMLTAMDAGEFGGLLVWHTDRLYRSMKDLERLIDIADARRVTIKTVQGGELDLSTSAGRMVARILGSVARQEGEHMSERRVRANRQKAEAGRWQTANRCFGYTLRGEPLEPEATAFKTAVADVLHGVSIRETARRWNAAGLKTTLAGQERKDEHGNVVRVINGKWSAPRVRRLLVNPRYAGLKVHRGKVVGKGNWPALIDEDTHRGLVAYLSDPSRIPTTSFERKYLGSRVYKCGVCNGLMRAARPGGKHAPPYRYECAEGQHVARIGPPLDEYVELVLLGYLSKPQTRKRLSVLLDGRKIDVGALQAQRTAIQAQLDELADLFAEGGIDGSQLRRGTSKLRTKLAEVDAVLAEATRRSPVANLFKDGFDKLHEHWGAASPDIKGKVLQELCDVIVNPAPRGPKFNPTYVDFNWKA